MGPHLDRISSPDPDERSRRGWTLFAALALVIGTGVMLPFGDLHRLGNVPPFLAGAAVMLVGFAACLRVPSMSPALLWTVAIGARLILLWQAPSGDIYRYVWEGRLLGSGINPYLHAPDSATLSSLRDALWQVVEHKSCTAIYPPLAEWMFAAIAGVSQSITAFKLVFAAADLGAALLLCRALGQARTRLYAWNPLVIYCFAGGGHYDSAFVLVLVLGWLAWRADRHRLAIFWLGVAVALKWLAIPLLGWALWRVLLRRDLRDTALAACAGALPFAVGWVALGLWTGEWTSHLMPAQFSTVARSAELVPRLVAALWKDGDSWFNPIFLLPLALAWAVVILRARTIESAAEWAFFLALTLSPMVHAWYFTWLVPFATRTRNLGTLLLSGSGFVYFLLNHQIEQPGGKWELGSVETAALWSPFVLGFLWSRLRPPVDDPPQPR